MIDRKAREVEINIPGLKNGEHSVQEEVNDAVCERFGGLLVEKGKGVCHLDVKKTDTMMQMYFTVEVNVELTCDRSLEPFEHLIDSPHELMVKFGEEDKELSEDLMIVSRDTQTFDTAPYIFEFIGLNIPMKKLHPKYDEVESPDLIFQTETETENQEDITDPRWEALKKLKQDKKDGTS